MVVDGVIQRDEDIIHVVVRRLEDGTQMLRLLSDDLMTAPLAPGDGAGAMRPPPGRHPRDVSVIPKSRDFH
jgi:error-prone DNA polymerase